MKTEPCSWKTINLRELKVISITNLIGYKLKFSQVKLGSENLKQKMMNLKEEYKKMTLKFLVSLTNIRTEQLCFINNWNASI